MILKTNQKYFFVIIEVFYYYIYINNDLNIEIITLKNK